MIVHEIRITAHKGPPPIVHTQDFGCFELPRLFMSQCVYKYNFICLSFFPNLHQAPTVTRQKRNDSVWKICPLTRDQMDYEHTRHDAILLYQSYMMCIIFDNFYQLFIHAAPICFKETEICLPCITPNFFCRLTCLKLSNQFNETFQM